MIPKLIKSYEASAAVAGRRIVAFSDTAASSKVAQASTALLPSIGISAPLGAESGEMCDVTLAGLAELTLGGTVTAGAPLTSDSDGKGVVAAAAAGATRRVIGFAMAPGVSGDIIDVLLAPSLLDRQAA